MHVAAEKRQSKSFLLRELLEGAKEKIAFGEMIVVRPFVQQIVVEFGQTEDGIRSFDDFALADRPRGILDLMENGFGQTDANEGEGNGEDHDQVVDRRI